MGNLSPHDSHRAVNGTVSTLMAEFDKMPKAVREALRNADQNYAANRIRSAMRRLGKSAEYLIAESDDNYNRRAAEAGLVIRQDRMLRVREAEQLLADLGL